MSVGLALFSSLAIHRDHRSVTVSATADAAVAQLAAVKLVTWTETA